MPRWFDTLLYNFHSYVDSICPCELETSRSLSCRSALYLNILWNRDINGKLLIFMTNDFNFFIVNFPYLYSNLPPARACSAYDQFLSRGKLLTNISCCKIKKHNVLPYPLYTIFVAHEYKKNLIFVVAFFDFKQAFEVFGIS